MKKLTLMSWIVKIFLFLTAIALFQVVNATSNQSIYEPTL